MIDAISASQSNFVGLIGAGVYLMNYALMQLGITRGNSYTYALLSILAASCVMVSLIHAFNFTSLVIQTSFILISLVGITRLFMLSRMVRFSPEEAAFVAHQIPLLRPHLARKLLNCGAFCTLPIGEELTKQGEKVISLAYLQSGCVTVDIDGHCVGTCIAGTYIGELTVLSREPATATVTTVAKTRCLILPTDRLAPLLKRHPEIHMALLASFSGDTREKLLLRNRDSMRPARPVLLHPDTLVS